MFFANTQSFPKKCQQLQLTVRGGYAVVNVVIHPGRRQLRPVLVLVSHVQFVVHASSQDKSESPITTIAAIIPKSLRLFFIIRTPCFVIICIKQIITMIYLPIQTGINNGLTSYEAVPPFYTKQVSDILMYLTLSCQHCDRFPVGEKTNSDQQY